MSLLESIRIALQSLASNKLRSGLTMLGMIIGVGAVIALVAAGAGAQAEVADRFESLGSNLLVISPARMFFRGISTGGTSAQGLTSKDAEIVEQLATSVSLVAPQYSSREQVVYGSNNTQTSIVGITPEYFAVRDYQIDQGRFLDDLDVTTRAKVVVLGAGVAEDLFGDTLVNPIGKTIKIRRQNYQVVGIAATKGTSGGFQNMDDQAFIPLSTAQLKFGGAGNTALDSINVQVSSADLMDFAEAQLSAIMRASHALTSTQSDDFTIQNQSDIVEMVQETTETFTVLLGSIAAISLVVGGIGIMNIMLVSVTERTREIGIRKAVGAKRRDLLSQFLVEAIVLSITGGFLGIVAGIAVAQAVTPLMGASRAVVTPESVAMALGVSLSVGLFFGIYPAARAAALNPIDALRYE